MKPNFEEFDQHRDLSGGTSQQQRFELLSAYLDGEVTPAERRQVQQWLDTDPQFQQLYVRLRHLQQAVPRICVPPSGISSEALSQQVFHRTGRQRALRLVWGGLAAAMATGIFSILWFRNDFLLPQRALLPQPTPKMEAEPLMIALNQPVFDLSPEKKANPN